MTPTDPIEERASRLDWPRAEAAQRLVEHLAGRHQMSDETHILILEMESEMTRLRAIEAAARPIADLADVDVRDYEQGLCFFCGAGHEVIPGPRGGTTGNRHLRPVHEPTCSYIALREALR